MKVFEIPEIEVAHFEAEDIMTTSGDTFNPDDSGEWT